MTKRFLFSTVVFLYGFGSFAQGDEALLWKIEHPKKQGPVSYLVGTIHMADERNDAWISLLEPLLFSAKTMAGEVDLRDMAKAQTSMSKMMFLENGKLKDLYGPEDYADIKRLLDAQYGSIAPFFENLKPIFTALMPAAEMMNRGEEGLVLDQRLQTLALEKGITVAGLEKADVTLNRLAQIDLKEQAAFLLHSLRKEKKEEEFTTEMLDYYFNDDTYALAAMSSEFSEFPALEKMLLQDRNVLFANNLLKLMKKGTVFCAVGALHLSGPKGMVQLLKDKGYRISPVKRAELLQTKRTSAE